MTNLLPNKTDGFSLVEALVAIAILLSAVSGVMMLVNQSIKSGQNVSNRLAASYLASDAIEYLRYSRDSNWLSDKQDSFQYWLNDVVDACNGSPCQIDTRRGSESISGCGGSCSNLKYNSKNKVYGYGSGSGWEESKFTRTVRFRDTTDLGGDKSNDEVIVAVTVTWPQGGGNTGELVLTDTLSSWGD
jgi:Tfp pilus assembly protein PilV